MKFGEFLSEEDAVSPVIGVILMVAVTVVMAAVVGSFVLGLTDDVGEIPTAQFDIETETEDGNVTAVEYRHRAGSRIDTDRLTVQLPTDREDVNGSETDGSVHIGDRVRVDLNQSSPRGLGPAGDEILLVWTSENGGDSTILAEHAFTEDYWDEIEDVESR